MMVCSILFLALLLFCPAAAVAGSKYGASLWISELLPTLLPFFIAIRLLDSCLPHLTEKRLFLLTGILCGYPTGAVLVTNQYNKGLLTQRQAYFYLGFVNNPSPMFILVFCGSTVLGLQTPECFFLFAILLLSSFTGSSLFSLLFRTVSRSASDVKVPMTPLPIYRQKASALSAQLDQIILDSFILLAKIGGYVILFSILGQYILALLSGHIIPSVWCAGTLEITSGISFLRAAPLAITAKKVLTLCLLAFGGLSAAAQTNSILIRSELSLLPYVINKILNSLIAGLLSLFLFRFF